MRLTKDQRIDVLVAYLLRLPPRVVSPILNIERKILYQQNCRLNKQYELMQELRKLLAKIDGDLELHGVLYAVWPIGHQLAHKEWPRLCHRICKALSKAPAWYWLWYIK